MEITGVLHVHSSYSYDAKLSLRELRELFIAEGVRFVCMTEHTDEITREKAKAFIAECDLLSNETFRFIPGFEVPYAKRTHVLLVGMREYFGNYAPDIHALRLWTKKTPFGVLAHPVRNNFKVDDGLLDELDAVEVWNAQYEGKQVPRARSLTLFRELHAKKPTLVGTGGLDFHRKEHMGTPRITLNVTELSEAQILNKLILGAFRVHSPQASFYGVLPNPDAVRKMYYWRSLSSVMVIAVGKWVSSTLATLGLSFPKSLKQYVRKRV